MKTLLLGMLIGAILWQLVCAITNIISKDDELTCFAGVGIWYIVAWLIITPIGSLQQWYNHKKYVAMLIDENGKPCYCKSSKVPDYLVNEKNFEWNDKIREKYTIKDGWKKEHCPFHFVNIRYTPIKIAKLENAYEVKVSKKELKNW